jgi:anhydro-N-acetylmuramic acid kinase
MSPNLKTAIGAISGTSMDGIDVALVRTDGHTAVEAGPGRTLPYPPSLRRDLIAFLDNSEIAESDPLKSLDDRVTEAFCDAISIFMQDEGLDSKNIDLIGLHGQTIWHRPEKRVTRQLGNGATLASRFGITVINSFRQADVLTLSCRACKRPAKTSDGPQLGGRRQRHIHR